MKDFYKILGVKRTATNKEIKSAYRNLAKKHHPDMTGKCDDEQFKDIHEAYSTLIDPEKRKTYNQNLGEKVKVNIVNKKRSGNEFFNATYRTQPEPLIPRQKPDFGTTKSFFEEELRYFERFRNYLLRRFFDDDFFF